MENVFVDHTDGGLDTAMIKCYYDQIGIWQPGFPQSPTPVGGRMCINPGGPNSACRISLTEFPSPERLQERLCPVVLGNCSHASLAALTIL